VLLKEQSQTLMKTSQGLEYIGNASKTGNEDGQTRADGRKDNNAE